MSYPGVCPALSGHASDKDTASEVGGSSYGNVHQMADLKPSTVAPGGERLHLGEGMPLERRMMETKWRWRVFLRKGPLASVGPKHRTCLTHQTTHGAILKRDNLGRRAGSQKVCEGSGTLAGEDAVSPNFTGPGPTPLKCSQPVKALLPRHKSSTSLRDPQKQPRQELLA